jgi:DNA-directed RNA polymerase II subunit RPB4
MLSFDPGHCLATHTNTEQARFVVEKPNEAKTVIPSLADKISDEDLEELLDEISKLMSDS